MQMSWHKSVAMFLFLLLSVSLSIFCFNEFFFASASASSSSNYSLPCSRGYSYVHFHPVGSPAMLQWVAFDNVAIRGEVIMLCNITRSFARDLVCLVNNNCLHGLSEWPVNELSFPGLVIANEEEGWLEGNRSRLVGNMGVPDKFDCYTHRPVLTLQHCKRTKEIFESFGVDTSIKGLFKCSEVLGNSAAS